MRLVELDDRHAIAAVAGRNPHRHAYELGDLDDFFWPHTRWFGLERDGAVRQLALLYSEPDPPVLLALADEPEAEMRTLLELLAARLPGRVYAHVTPAAIDALTGRFAGEEAGLHLKMGLLDPSRLAEQDVVDRDWGGTAWLSHRDVAEIDALYAEAYPGTWFTPRMLDTGRYLGIRVAGRLRCIAGVHVWSPTWGVAALGNVATDPVFRGRGLATAACARLCRVLLDDGIGAVALNVRADNAPALAAYRTLGFAPVGEYVEVMLTARQGLP
jgi:ribosomal protein S18 acetylase RimI-like enzyme